MSYLRKDTICAIATASGTAAMSIIRLSGEESLKIASKSFVFKRKGLSIDKIEVGRMYYGEIYGLNGELIDDVMFTYFQAPHSYTGENSVEIVCHGSKYVQHKILELMIHNGARLSEPGEYSKRAFLNNKMDLTQAEAVADLISSQNEAEHRLAINQLKGGFSRELKVLRSKILDLTSLLELELDFAEEDVEFADRSKLNNIIEEAFNHIKKLTDSFKQGNAIKKGIPVAIVGDTNAGKSTLLNSLIGEERAIVSDIAGTTRDTIEEAYIIKGKTYRFIDTAGIRETDDTIEKMGIERSFKKIKEAEIVIGMLDLSKRSEEYFNSARLIIDNVDLLKQKLIILFNKIDLTKSKDISQEVIDKELNDNIKRKSDSFATDDKYNLSDLYKYDFISAKNEEDINRLKVMIDEYGEELIGGDNEIMVSNLRHYEALMKASEALIKVREAIEAGISTEFVAQDLKEVLYHLGSITGEISSTDILKNIFGRFCIGK